MCRCVTVHIIESEQSFSAGLLFMVVDTTFGPNSIQPFHYIPTSVCSERVESCCIYTQLCVGVCIQSLVMHLALLLAHALTHSSILNMLAEKLGDYLLPIPCAFHWVAALVDWMVFGNWIGGVQLGVVLNKYSYPGAAFHGIHDVSVPVFLNIYKQKFVFYGNYSL